MGEPAARLTDLHTCPMDDPGPVPHVGGPVITPGQPNVLIGGVCAARVTDQCVCVGPPDMILKGSATVLIGGLQAARLGDNCEHGGVIVEGEPTVLIGEGSGTPDHGSDSDNDSSPQLDLEISDDDDDNRPGPGEPLVSQTGTSDQPGGNSPGQKPSVLLKGYISNNGPGGAGGDLYPRTAMEDDPCAKLAQAAIYATLANHTYGKNPETGEDPPVPTGYSYLDPRTQAGRNELNSLGLTSESRTDVDPDKSGFKADVFKDRNGQYVVAFRGTRKTEGQDWLNNATQGTGLPSDYYQRAMAVARRISASTGGNVSFTGHSLGGGLASAAAFAANKRAITFNAAGLNAETVRDYQNPTAPVTAYYIPGEVLSTLQDNRGVVLPALVAALSFIDRTSAAVLESIILTQEFRGRPMMPQAFGQRQALPVVASPGYAQNNPILRSVDMHGMDWISRGIKAEQAQRGCD